jgi:hypothetical protein
MALQAALRLEQASASDGGESESAIAAKAVNVAGAKKSDLYNAVWTPEQVQQCLDEDSQLVVHPLGAIYPWSFSAVPEHCQSMQLQEQEQDMVDSAEEAAAALQQHATAAAAAAAAAVAATDIDEISDGNCDKQPSGKSQQSGQQNKNSETSLVAVSAQLVANVLVKHTSKQQMKRISMAALDESAQNTPSVLRDAIKRTLDEQRKRDTFKKKLMAELSGRDSVFKAGLKTPIERTSVEHDIVHEFLKTVPAFQHNYASNTPTVLKTLATLLNMRWFVASESVLLDSASTSDASTNSDVVYVVLSGVVQVTFYKQARRDATSSSSSSSSSSATTTTSMARTVKRNSILRASQSKELKLGDPICSVTLRRGDVFDRAFNRYNHRIVITTKAACTAVLTLDREFRSIITSWQKHYYSMIENIMKIRSPMLQTLRQTEIRKLRQCGIIRHIQHRTSSSNDNNMPDGGGQLCKRGEAADAVFIVLQGSCYCRNQQESTRFANSSGSIQKNASSYSSQSGHNSTYGSASAWKDLITVTKQQYIDIIQRQANSLSTSNKLSYTSSSSSSSSSSKSSSSSPSSPLLSAAAADYDQEIIHVGDCIGSSEIRDDMHRFERTVFATKGSIVLVIPRTVFQSVVKLEVIPKVVIRAEEAAATAAAASKAESGSRTEDGTHAAARLSIVGLSQAMLSLSKFASRLSMPLQLHDNNESDTQSCCSSSIESALDNTGLNNEQSTQSSIASSQGMIDQSLQRAERRARITYESRIVNKHSKHTRTVLASPRSPPVSTRMRPQSPLLYAQSSISSTSLSGTDANGQLKRHAKESHMQHQQASSSLSSSSPLSLSLSLSRIPAQPTQNKLNSTAARAKKASHRTAQLQEQLAELLLGKTPTGCTPANPMEALAAMSETIASGNSEYDSNSNSSSSSSSYSNCAASRTMRNQRNLTTVTTQFESADEKPDKLESFPTNPSLMHDVNDRQSTVIRRKQTMITKMQQQLDQQKRAERQLRQRLQAVRSETHRASDYGVRRSSAWNAAKKMYA